MFLASFMLSSFFFSAFVLIVFLAMMSVLVVAHELGHYLAARWFKMGVEEFSVGIGGKPIWTYMRRKHLVPITHAEAEEFAREAAVQENEPSKAGQFLSSLEGGGPRNERTGTLVQTPDGPAIEDETVFTVRPIPLGGFVRVKGMIPEDDGSETRIPGGLYSKPPYQRFIVFLAGPLFSVLAGILLLIPYFMVVGQTVPDKAAVVGHVAPGKAGDKGGLKDGDAVIAVNGMEAHSFYEVVSVVRDHPGEKVSLEVVRDGKTVNLEVVPERDPKPTPVLGPDLKPTDARKIQGKIGVGPKVHHEPMTLGAAVQQSLEIPIEAIGGLFAAVMHPSDLKDSVGGPETMIRATADAASQSLGQVIFLAGLLSISVGIFNLLPFPPLDGGQMILALAEALRGGRRLSIKAQSTVLLTGLTIVALMVVSVIVIDFQRYRSATTEEVSAPAKR